MLVSTTMLKRAVEKFQQNRRSMESYSKFESAEAGASAAFVTFALIIAIIFLIIELLVLFYAIDIAFKCTNPGKERTVHILLAIMFTAPYMLLNIFFNKCAKTTLRSD